MKHIMARAAISAALTLTATAAFGQTTANVPFAFRISGGELPAGHYKIQQQNAGSGNVLLSIRNAETGQSYLANAPLGLSSRSGTKPHLTFVCQGNDCALTQVWTDSFAGYGLSTRPPQQRVDTAQTYNVDLNKSDAKSE
jgi:hypothetical protein